MEITRSLLLILHFIGMAGLLGGLLASSKSLNKGVLHSSLLALVAGLGLVGIRYPLNEADPMRWDSVNHTQVGIKLVILLTILILGYRAKRKENLSKNTWLAMVLLTVTAIVIAVVW
jgi:NADH:ubiquinone oxidoreductase subunit 2 (subunit N)